MTYAELAKFIDKSGRPMPLTRGRAWNPEVSAEVERTPIDGLFREVRSPRGAMAGLWLYLGEWDRAHDMAQALESSEGAYWHAIVHRQEPDSWNSNYWFRVLGSHPIFPDLAKRAAVLARAKPGVPFRIENHWDPGAFVAFCDIARERANSESEALAVAIQHLEWKMLFDYCARR